MSYIAGNKDCRHFLRSGLLKDIFIFSFSQATYYYGAHESGFRVYRISLCSTTTCCCGGRWWLSSRNLVFRRLIHDKTRALWFRHLGFNIRFFDEIWGEVVWRFHPHVVTGNERLLGPWSCYRNKWVAS